MALYIEFRKKGHEELTPPSVLDEEICSLLNLPVHESNYCWLWLDLIGEPIAWGKTKEELIEMTNKAWVPRESEKDEKYLKDIEEGKIASLKIIDYLFETYDFTSYRRAS